MSLLNYPRTDDRHLQSFTSVLLWRTHEPTDRSNLIKLGLTNNSCQNVSASCGLGRSWICHTGIEVKLESDMASPSNTGLRTLISFMTVPNSCLHHSAGPSLLWGTQHIVMRKEILSICLQYIMSYYMFYHIRPSIVAQHYIKKQDTKM